MSSNRQFASKYEYVISLLKKFKSTNDRLNKSIGVDPPPSIAIRIHAEQSSHQEMQNQLETQIARLEDSYLDPDTARKIGTVKQQFRIQKDRWAYLVQAVEMENIGKQQNAGYLDQQTKNAPSSSKGANHQDNYHPAYDKHRTSNQSLTTLSSNTGPSHIHIQQEEQLSAFDLEIEHKIMRERHKAINQVTSSLLNAQSILEETAGMVKNQGDNIDIIGDQIFTALKNTREAGQNLIEANEMQKKSKKKYVYLSIFVILAVFAVVLIVVI